MWGWDQCAQFICDIRRWGYLWFLGFWWMVGGLVWNMEEGFWGRVKFETGLIWCFKGGQMVRGGPKSIIVRHVRNGWVRGHFVADRLLFKTSTWMVGNLDEWLTRKMSRVWFQGHVILGVFVFDERWRRCQEKLKWFETWRIFKTARDFRVWDGIWKLSQSQNMICDVYGWFLGFNYDWNEIWSFGAKL